MFTEAWNHPDKKECEAWQAGIKKEFIDTIKQGVWKLINKESILAEWSLIGNKWIFKQKKNIIHRARLVALGYSQIPGVEQNTKSDGKRQGNDGQRTVVLSAPANLEKNSGPIHAERRLHMYTKRVT